VNLEHFYGKLETTSCKSNVFEGDFIVEPNALGGVKILFEQGIPGFEYLRYFLISKPFEEYPFYYLQSAEEENICFLTLNPFELTKSYEFDLPSPAQEMLEINDLTDVLVFNIVNTRGDLNNATVNLQAPVIINIKKNIGMQVVLNDNQLNLREPLQNLLKGR